MTAGLSTLELRSPASLDEALRMMRDEGPLVPLAGCTDVFVGLHFGTQPARRYVDVRGLDPLGRIEWTDDWSLSIGAGVSYTRMARSPEVRTALPMLVDAALTVGGVQIQNRGTLGGNLANASPAGDSLPVLAAADAVVVLRSVDGERRVPVTEFFTGYRATVLRPDELIVTVEIPPVEGPQWFRKVGTRAAQAISKVVFAGVGGERPRIAIGSVGPTVVRCWRTEEALASGASMGEAQAVLAEEIAPIDDVRSTTQYRLRVSLNLLNRFVEETRG